MKNTDQTLTNNFTAGDMADQAAKAFRDGINKAIEVASTHNDMDTLIQHLALLRDGPDADWEASDIFGNHSDYVIDGLKFVNTCGACPEQYDVFTQDGRHTGYVRLRFGRFRVDCPDIGGETVYVWDFDEEYKGVFSPDERPKFLKEAAVEINKYLQKYDL